MFSPPTFMNLYNSNQSYAPLTLNQKINLETARISWHELQPHFARGACIYVAPQLDLVTTAEMIATDNIRAIELLIQKGEIGFISDQQAQTYFNCNQAMWAVVVLPYVLVQPQII